MKNILYENKTLAFEQWQTNNLTSIPHLHKSIEIVVVLEGEAYAIADRYKGKMQSGDIFISFPNQIHYYEVIKTEKVLVFIFTPDMLFELKGTLYDNIPKSNLLHNMAGSKILKLLLSVFKAEGEYSRTAIAGLLNQAMALIMQELKLKPRVKTNNSTLQDILKYCSANFASNITLDDVAKALHISKYHISNLLNNKLKINFNSYINGLKINSACDLLEDTDMKMSDISEEVGFGSIRSFNRAFRQTMNMTPIQYRNQFSQTATRNE